MSNGTQPSDEQVAQQSREFLHDVFIDDVTQKMAIGRAVMAAGYGIDPRPYARPFPGTQSHVTMASANPKEGKGLSSLAAAALGVVGGVGGLGGVMALLSQFGGVPATQATIEPVEYRVVFDGEEGVKVERESASEVSQ